MHDQAPADALPILNDTPSPGVRRITLNRPDRLNALTAQMLNELHAALDTAASDTTVRCVLLTGAGRAFCAGQDLNDRDPRKLETMPDLEAIQRTLFHPVVETMRTMQKPVVAAVQGVAAGAGSSIALAADIVIASRSAKFIQSFSKVGLSVDAGGGWHLTKALGAARARGLLLTGGMLQAPDALDAGLIWQCVEDDDLAPESEMLAGELASGPTTAYASIKSAIAAAETEPDLSAYLLKEAELQGIAGQTEDYREGVLSFFEKRKAEFHGN